MALDHAREAGEALSNAKALLKHGEWSQWVEDNFEGTQRNAQQYMQLYMGWEQLKNQNDIATLSFRAAIAQLQTPKTEEDLLENVPVEEQKLLLDLYNEITGGVKNEAAFRKFVAVANGVMSEPVEKDDGEDVPWSHLTGAEKKRILAREYNKKNDPPKTRTVHEAELERLYEIVNTLLEFNTTGDKDLIDHAVKLAEEQRGYYGGGE